MQGRNDKVGPAEKDVFSVNKMLMVESNNSSEE